ncbi:hypothetical protein A2Y85_01040 [candidate division WOR-3 bacterium RBG_13_43_14]|uniref:Nickel transport protein n=1 Tax=candidate division WOR-3 bacterium RBG_13_43_14 TaxID=1802590 RepID=A0A1F4UCB9_UNCW3|nr:MAG: hypothetical protein A2Y85_01040 [candidate division WOR-3 bacterium RBG_13_43_14]
MNKNILCGLSLLISLSLTHAHKINILANVEGSIVYTQVYLSNGDPVKNCMIEVHDPNNKKLLEGKTDQNGEFSFTVPAKTDLKIIANASMGHLAETVIKASELPEIKTVNKTAVKTPVLKTPVTDKKEIDETELRRLLSEVIDEKLHPIARRLSHLERKTISATDVIGGIGYIFGLMGVIMYLRSRRKK